MIEIEISKRRYHEVNDMVRWCTEQFGQGGWLAKPYDRWTLEQAFGESSFKFKDEKDATLFTLKWV